MFGSRGVQDAFEEGHFLHGDLGEGGFFMAVNPMRKVVFIADRVDSSEGEVGHEGESVSGNPDGGGGVKELFAQVSQRRIVGSAHPYHTGSVAAAKEAGAVKPKGKRSMFLCNGAEATAHLLGAYIVYLTEKYQRKVHLPGVNPADTLSVEIAGALRQQP
jgi:hypothetical protein